MRLILMTDLHLRDPEGSAESSAHAVFVGACLDRAAAICPDADCCILTGDLADAGETGAYRWLKRRLDALAFKSIPLLGNHDDRHAFRSVFGGVGFCQSVRQFGAMRLVFLDTLNPGSDAGKLCATRLEWLDQQLRDAAQTDVCLFMHHPPCDIGDPILDPIKLQNTDDFAALLQRHGNVKQIFFGHVHRTLFRVWNGIPCISLDSIGAASTGRSQSDTPALGLVYQTDEGLALTLRI